jgi:hypothetical protein
MSEIRRNNGQLLSPLHSTPCDDITGAVDISFEEGQIIMRFDRSESDFAKSNLELSDNPLDFEVKEWHESGQFLVSEPQITP